MINTVIFGKGFAVVRIIGETMGISCLQKGGL